MAGPGAQRWLTRRAVLAHVALAIWVPGCALATWWQVRIGLGGDSLGWVYSVMWPFFAAFATVFWWFLVHDDPETLGARGLARRSGGPDVAATTQRAEVPRQASDDGEVAAYNAYLASLAGRPKTWRRPR